MVERADPAPAVTFAALVVEHVAPAPVVTYAPVAWAERMRSLQDLPLAERLRLRREADAVSAERAAAELLSEEVTASAPPSVFPKKRSGEDAILVQALKAQVIDASSASSVEKDRSHGPQGMVGIPIPSGWFNVVRGPRWSYLVQQPTVTDVKESPPSKHRWQRGNVVQGTSACSPKKRRGASVSVEDVHIVELRACGPLRFFLCRSRRAF